MEDRSANPYSLLAEGYDAVMEHVDYVAWSEYLFALIQEHHPSAQRILELGCGTGSLAIELQQLGSFDYTASDLSQEMVEVAIRKAYAENRSVSFLVDDFRTASVESVPDVILLVYDGINYLTDVSDVQKTFGSVFDALKPGGLFVFDLSTPTNSLNHKDGFDDAGNTEAFRYLRSSKYDPASQIHTTLFRLEVDGKTFTETHRQRAYSLGEMKGLIESTSFEIEAAYDGFSFDGAHGGTERIHWVLRKPLDV